MSLLMSGTAAPIVWLRHSRNVRLSVDGSGVSSESGSAGIEGDEGILAYDAAELLYTSRVNAKVDARYHCTTCSG